jgi:hypothetical protein
MESVEQQYQSCYLDFVFLTGLIRKRADMNKLLVNLMLCIALAMIAGCKHVPMVSKVEDATSKQFRLPSSNMAGIYIYRDSGWTGKAQVKSVWLDGQLLGGLSNATYFTLEIGPGAHTLSTQAESGPNDFHFSVSRGRNYYISEVFSRKVPVVGVVVGPFVSVATFELVSEQEGQSAVLKSQQAVLQNVSAPSAPAHALVTTQSDCVSDLESDPELQSISRKVALSGKEDNLSSLLSIKVRPTQNEQKVIVKWGNKRERCFNVNPPPRDVYYQLSVDTFKLGQKLIMELSKGEMTYGQFAERRKEIKQASLAKVQSLQAK